MSTPPAGASSPGAPDGVPASPTGASRVDVARAAAAALDALRTRPPPWTPLPHQVPPPGDWYGWLLLAGRGAGKGLALDTPLPTPTGWTTMGEVDVGDELLDEEGQPCRVVSTSPVRRLDCHALTLATGETLTCDGDHLWSVVTHYARHHHGAGPGSDWRDEANWAVSKTLNVRELSARSRHKWRIPLTRPLVGSDTALPIDPYLLGAWLGDGDSRRLWIAISPDDREIIDECARRSGWLASSDLWTYGDRNPLLGAKFHPLDEPGPTLLRRLNLLANKHVPAVYLRASRETRLALLRGIMDTDGHAHGRADSTKSSQHASIGLKSERLARDVFELVASLGGHPQLARRVKKLNYRDEPYIVWCVTFTLDTNPFFLARKRASYDARPSTQAWRRTAHRVVSLTPTESVPTRCITVDSPRALYLAGRSMIPTHNTDAVAHYVTQHIHGPPCLRGNGAPHWVGIIAPTLGDAVTACFAGPSGIRAHDPTAKLVQSPGGTVVRWPNGSEAKLFGAREPEDVERLRAGGNRCLIWVEELAAWRYLQACWEQMRFGLRSGPRPHWVGSTTPKPRPLIKKLAKETPANVVVTKASTRDNPHLHGEVRAALHEEYGGTQLGRQELDAELLEEDRDALWTRESLDRFRLVAPPDPGRRTRTVVGVDPSGGAGEQGIVVVTKVPPEALRGLVTTADAYAGGPDPPVPGPGARVVYHGVVLDDRTCCLPPAGWGRRAVRAAVDWDADELVVERNYGGAMATATLLDACEAEGVTLPVREVVASRGKRVRAEPVSALSARGRWHMAGYFAELEDQCCTWTPESGYSPDRLDAMVWPAWQLRLATLTSRGLGSLATGMARTSLTGGR